MGFDIWFTSPDMWPTILFMSVNWLFSTCMLVVMFATLAFIHRFN